MDLEAAKKRCEAVIERVTSLNITDSCRRTLLKLLQSEFSFLSHFPSATPTPLSLNIGHLDAVVSILEQPSIAGLSRVCKPLPLPPPYKGVHIDIVCTLDKIPVWILVSDRNPKYVSWHGSQGSKGFRSRIQQLLHTARRTHSLRPSSIILFFSSGLGDLVLQKLQHEFGASQPAGEWVNALLRLYGNGCVLELKVDPATNVTALPTSEARAVDACPPVLKGANENLKMGGSFSSLLSRMRVFSVGPENQELGEKWDFMNFDTTSLIALVSGISNGCTDKLLAAPEVQLRRRFKGNYEFVIAQAKSEIQNPMHGQLNDILIGKSGIACVSVDSEFKELVTMCGGPNEKRRADQLLKCILVVPDRPSERMMSLPTTRKLALKNKIAFGTGDHWHAPTLTANVAFVRAVAQTGMSLCTIEHRPRALIGD